MLNAATHDTIGDTSLEGTPLRVPRARVCERGAFRFSVIPKRLKRPEHHHGSRVVWQVLFCLIEIQ